jgi:Flp pilus assembly protein TadD
MPLFNQLKTRPSQLVIAAVLLLAACAPTPHTDGVIGGGADTMLRVGDAARDAGDITAAIPIYRRAHALAPHDAIPLERLAETLHRVRAYREAGNAWNRALIINPDNFNARLGYGETLAALAQPTLALEQFRRAAEIGTSAPLFNGIGVANDQLGDPAAAQIAYRRGIKITRSLELLNNLGLSLALTGEFAEAIAILEEATNMVPAGSRHRANLAIAYLVSGNAARSQEVLVRDMDDDTALRTVGYFNTVLALPGHAAKVAALGAGAAGTGSFSTQNARAFK